MDYWILLGFAGQVFFSSRFIVQWVFSEKRKKSYVPKVFWYLSVVGGTLLFVYALHIKDIVFTVGQGAGLFVYMRNIILINRAGSSV